MVKLTVLVFVSPSIVLLTVTLPERSEVLRGTVRERLFSKEASGISVPLLSPKLHVMVVFLSCSNPDKVTIAFFVKRSKDCSNLTKKIGIG